MSTEIPPGIRQQVYERDGLNCRLCGRGVAGTFDAGIHHIKYRSEGGPHELWNLVLLCGKCHRLAHSSKHVWQPFLFQCAERTGVTAFQLKRWAERKRRV